jgi:hypothetical protein
MAKNTRFVGLDVHAKTLSRLPRDAEKCKRGDCWARWACYEAGPTGYALYWKLTAMGIACEVIAHRRRALVLQPPESTRSSDPPGLARAVAKTFTPLVS